MAFNDKICKKVDYLTFKYQLLSAVIISTVFFLVLHAVEKLLEESSSTTYWIVKLTDRGYTQHCTIFLSFLTLVILTKKYCQWEKNKNILQSFPAHQLAFSSEENIPQVISTLKAQPPSLRDRFLRPALCRALTHFQTSRNIKETDEVLTESYENNLDELYNSYSLVRVFLWTIPILGFIGTVMGVGKAVGEFASFLKAGAKEIDQIKEALTGVTDGLSTAFDTTFVALVCTVGLMILSSWMEHAEREQLTEFDAFARNQLLPGLQKLVVGKKSDDFLLLANELQTLTGAVYHLTPPLQNLPTDLETLFSKAIPNLETWKTQVKETTETLAAELHKVWQEANNQFVNRIDKLSNNISMIEQQLRSSADALSTDRRQLDESTQTIISHLKAETDKLVASLQAHLQQEETVFSALINQGKDTSLKTFEYQKEEFFNLVDVVKKILSGEGETYRHFMNESQASLANSQKLQREQFQTLVDKIDLVVGKIQAVLEMQQYLEDTLKTATGSQGMIEVMRNLTNVMEQLKPVVSRLADKPIGVEVQFVPRLSGG